MNDNLLEIKVLFKKIHNARVWANTHPQEKHSERWDEKLFPMLEDYYDSLVELGVPREFSMCLFCFGIDYLVAVNSWKNELPAQEVPESLIVGPQFPAEEPEQQTLVNTHMI